MYSGFTVMTAEQWQEAVTAPGRRVKTKVVINNSVTLYGDSTDGAVVSIMYDEQMEASTGLGMGGTVASQCKVGIRQPSTPVNLANSTFIPYVGLTYQGVTEYVPAPSGAGALAVGALYPAALEAVSPFTNPDTQTARTGVCP